MRKYSKRGVCFFKDALKKSGFKEEFTYLGENIPNDINK